MYLAIKLVEMREGFSYLKILVYCCHVRIAFLTFKPTQAFSGLQLRDYLTYGKTSQYRFSWKRIKK